MTDPDDIYPRRPLTVPDNYVFNVVLGWVSPEENYGIHP